MSSSLYPLLQLRHANVNTVTKTKCWKEQKVSLAIHSKGLCTSGSLVFLKQTVKFAGSPACDGHISSQSVTFQRLLLQDLW